jgi:hypothetical protein
MRLRTKDVTRDVRSKGGHPILDDTADVVQCPPALRRCVRSEVGIDPDSERASWGVRRRTHPRERLDEGGGAFRSYAAGAAARRGSCSRTRPILVIRGSRFILNRSPSVRSNRTTPAPRSKARSISRAAACSSIRSSATIGRSPTDAAGAAMRGIPRGREPRRPRRRRRQGRDDVVHADRRHWAPGALPRSRTPSPDD